MNNLLASYYRIMNSSKSIKIFTVWCSVNLRDNYVFPQVQTILTSVSPEAEVTLLTPKQITTSSSPVLSPCKLAVQHKTPLIPDKPWYTDRTTGESWNRQFNSKQVCATLRSQVHSYLAFGHVKLFSSKEHIYVLTQSNRSFLIYFLNLFKFMPYARA